MFDRAIECWGGIDILINNAGIQIEDASHEIPLADFRSRFGCQFTRGLSLFPESDRPFFG